MIECSLAQECEGERKGSGATNRPCCLCLASHPITGAESLVYWCSSMLSLGGVRHLSGLSHRRDLPVWFCSPRAHAVEGIFVGYTQPCLRVVSWWLKIGRHCK